MAARRAPFAKSRCAVPHEDRRMEVLVRDLAAANRAEAATLVRDLDALAALKADLTRFADEAGA